MATLFDGISQQLDFASCGEEGSSSDNGSDDYTATICSPRIRSPKVASPGAACRTPRVQRHRSRSNTISSPLQCTSPIPYASWSKLRLCESPSTPKVGNASDQLRQNPSPVPGWLVKVSLERQTDLISVRWTALHFFPPSRVCYRSRSSLAPAPR